MASNRPPDMRSTQPRPRPDGSSVLPARQGRRLIALVAAVVILGLVVWAVLAFVTRTDSPATRAEPGHVPQPAVPATVTRAIDGDTLAVLARPWPDIIIEANIRVRGIDAPEIRGKCEAEKALAEDAKTFTGQLVGENVALHDVEHDKYGGRYVATVLVAGENLAGMLIEAGLARPYEGGRREGWCARPSASIK